MRFHKRLLFTLLLVSWTAGDALAAPLQVGAAIPPITAKDQHGFNYIFTNGTAYLLVVLDGENAQATK